MPADLLPLFLGAAYACAGLSALRLARLEGIRVGWIRLSIAGLAAAALEWYSLLSLTFIGRHPNDLPGSILAIVALGAFLEFSRHAIAARFHLGPVAQTLAGAVITAVGILALGITEGGIYDRLVFTQRAVGLSLAAVALMVVAPRHQTGAGWTRGAGGALAFGLFAAFAWPSAWPLVPAVAAMAILLRISYIVGHVESRRSYVIWNILELVAVVLILTVSTMAAKHSGKEILRLEGDQFLRLTQTAAAALAPQDVTALEGSPVDLSSEAYEHISRRLLAIQRLTRSASDPATSSRYAYLMALRDGGVVFLADEPYDPHDPVTPGDLYEEASPELLKAFHTGSPFLEGPLADRYGVWVSAFAPVRDFNGRVIALLGIDFDAADWQGLKENARLATILTGLLVLIVTLSIFTSVALSLEDRDKLRRSEQMFRTAADYTATWEYWVGPDGKMLHNSPSCERVTGYRAAALLDHPRRLLSLVHPDDRPRIAEHLRTCSRDTPPCEFDFKIRRKDGSEAWISHTCQSVYDASGRWRGRRASNRDITAQRTAELTLARSERLQRGCQHALRRLLGSGGSRYAKDALQFAGEAGDCSCATLMRMTPDQSLEPVANWPSGEDMECPIPWKKLRERALPILAVGEVFEILPRETKTSVGLMCGAHVAMLPLLDGGDLWGVASFAAPPEREQWSRAELATLATLASGLAVALTREQRKD